MPERIPGIDGDGAGVDLVADGADGVEDLRLLGRVCEGVGADVVDEEGEGLGDVLDEGGDGPLGEGGREGGEGCRVGGRWEWGVWGVERL